MARYRKEVGVNAKLVVVAMASNRFTIGDKQDPLSFERDRPKRISARYDHGVPKELDAAADFRGSNSSANERRNIV